MILFTVFFLLNSKIQLEHIPSSFVTGYFSDVKKVDTIIYFTTARGLEIFNWHTDSMQMVSRYATDGLACGLDIAANYAYIADHYNGLNIVEVSNPTAPRMIGNYDTDGKTYDVLVRNRLAYLADNGLLILDVADPSTPKLIGYYKNNNESFSITIKDTLAYLGHVDSPLRILNIADPSNPTVIGEFPRNGSGGYGIDAFIDDTLAYINCGGFLHQGRKIRFAIVDISDPTNPVFISGLSIPSTTRGIEKYGDYVYTNAQSDGIYIIDVSDPEAPFVISQYCGSHWCGYGFIIDDSILLVPHFLDGFSVADISDPQKILKLHHHKNVVWKNFTFAKNNSYFHILGQVVGDRYFDKSIVRIVDNNHAYPEAGVNISISGRGSLYDGSLDYSYLAVTISRGSPVNDTLYTLILDFDDPSIPRFIRFVEGGGITELHMPFLYALDDSKIRIADVNDDFFWVDSVMLPVVGYDIEVNDTVAYVTVEDSLVIVNLSSGDILGSCKHGNKYARNISFDFPHIVVPYTPHPGSSYGFLLFDISDPSSPQLLFDTLIHAPPVAIECISVMGCEIKDTLLYFGRGDYGFDIWKIAYPADSVYRLVTQETPNLATHSYPGGNANIHATENRVFVMDGGSLEIYELLTKRQ